MGLPEHIARDVFASTVGFARNVAICGVGEGAPAHGFALVMCDPIEMMQKDGDGDPVFGISHDDNTLFEHSSFNIIGLKDAAERQVLNEINKDGMVLIDGRTGRFAAS